MIKDHLIYYVLVTYLFLIEISGLYGSSSSIHKSLNEKTLHSKWMHVFQNSFVQGSVVLSN